MSETELQDLAQEVKRRKRIASEWASRLHDLVEDRLPAGYQELPAVAQSTYEACQAWAEAEQAFKSAQG
ncbi:MAG: CCE_0567 family metalloprotein [Thiohalomonadaceae bacterium]